MVLKKCEELHKTGENGFEEYKLTQDTDGIGMICGGVAKVFFEYYAPTKRIYVFGAGHLCRSIIPVLKSIGFYVTVIDNRPDYSNKEKLPLADVTIASDYVDFLEDFEPDKEDAIVIFTHGHRYDFDILDILCKRDLHVKYLGMIGSKLKVAEAITKIRKKKYKSNLLDKLYAPIGLNIGKETTQEIAIAITAEILAIYNNVQNIESLSRKFRK